MTSQRISRRDFLKGGTLAAGLALGFPSIVPSSAFARPGGFAPSDRITLGIIGTGGMGTAHVRGMSVRDDVQLLAVCDVDREHRERARGIVNENHAGRMKKGTYKGCAAYNDFRELLARDDIEAVIIATPDHWHALICLAAAKAGKDIYCEKPLTRTIHEGRVLVATMKRYGRILQVGSHQRSMPDFRQAASLARTGRIGTLHTVELGLYGGSRPAAPADHPPMPIPEGFDYDMWLGPAPWAPYTKGRCHGSFRANFDYSGGCITDWGAHHIDIAQLGIGADDRGPVEIDAKGVFPTEGIYNTAMNYHAVCTYANGVKLVCSDRFPPGVKFIGTQGWVFANRGSLDASPKALVARKVGPFQIIQYSGNNHPANFLECIRTRREPAAPVEAGHRTATVCHLINLSMRLDRKLHWSPEKERFVNDPEADKMISRAMRAPWRL